LTDFYSFAFALTLVLDIIKIIEKGYVMIYPLEQLVEFNGNIYEITVAASRRAYQMAKIEDPEIAANSDKVVSVAARQLFNNKVKYCIEESK